MPRRRMLAATPYDNLGSKRTAPLPTQLRDSKRQKIVKQSPSKTTKTSPPTTFPGFLSLPPEIRQLILRQVVKSPRKIRLQRHKDKGLKVRQYAKHSLRRLHKADYANLSCSNFSVALTCRQLYLEASNLYYSLNTFKCTANWPLELGGASYPNPYYLPFLTAIGPTNTASIAHFSLTYSCRHLALNITSLPANLRTLKIKFHDHAHLISPILERFTHEKEDVALTIEFGRICCSTWSDRLDDFKNKFGLVRNDEGAGTFFPRTLLSRPARIEKAAVN